VFLIPLDITEMAENLKELIFIARGVPGDAAGWAGRRRGIEGGTRVVQPSPVSPTVGGRYDVDR
jgi:hypothetical protein